jgi:hypothetical protein
MLARHVDVLLAQMEQAEADLAAPAAWRRVKG